MPTLDRLDNELTVNDEFVIRGRVVEIYESDGEGSVLLVEWLTGPTPFLNYVRAETVEKVQPSEE